MKQQEDYAGMAKAIIDSTRRCPGEHFTVYNYDRRGRGDSGDTRPFAKEREIEDLQALVEEAGGKAMVFGISSGSAVALDTAAVTPGIRNLIVYEAPFIVDESRQPVPTDYAQHLRKLADEGKRDEAVEYFMIQAVGIPADYKGQTHMVDPRVLAPVLIEFFTKSQREIKI